MFREIQKLFQTSWEAFQAEVSRREPEDEVAELLSLMRREMVAARAALPEFETAQRQAHAELERERAALTDCHRRRDLAARIGDTETARVADEFAARHTGRITVLEQKLAATSAELELRRRETEEMMSRYRQADLHRFGLVAELRRTRARDWVSGAAGMFDEHGSGSAAGGDPLRDPVLDEMSEMEGRRERDAREAEVERRLDEIKRRMDRG
jgi:phage shock protein A